MTGSDVRHVTGSEPVRKYVLRMYNRKLRNIRPSWAFWSEVTKSHDRKRPCPEVAMTGSGFYACPHPRKPRRDQMTFGSHVTTVLLLRKKRGEKSGHAQNLLLVRTTSGQGLFRSRDFVTSGQKSPLWWILRNFRLCMRRTYFRTYELFPLRRNGTWLSKSNWKDNEF